MRPDGGIFALTPDMPWTNTWLGAIIRCRRVIVGDHFAGTPCGVAPLGRFARRSGCPRIALGLLPVPEPEVPPELLTAQARRDLTSPALSGSYRARLTAAPLSLRLPIRDDEYEIGTWLDGLLKSTAQ